MALPDLCLRPHEAGDLAPREPLCAPAVHRVSFRYWFDRKWYLARPILNSSRQTQWVLRRQGDVNAPLLSMGSADAFHANYADFVADKRQPKWSLSRTIYVDANGRLAEQFGEWERRLWISPFGQTFWVRRDEGCKFRWKSLQHADRFPHVWWARSTSAQIAAELGALLEEETSPCRFAWRWLDMSRQQKNAQLFLVKRGTLDLCEQIVRAIWRSEPSLEIPDGERCQVELASGHALSPKFASFAMEKQVRGTGIRRANFSSRQERLLRIVYDDFGLHYNSELARNILDRRNGTHEDLNWIIPISHPTAHEKLEAHLSLRDFLRDKLALTEMGELIGES